KIYMKTYCLISTLMQITILIKSTIQLTAQTLQMLIHTFQMLFYILHFGKYFFKVFGKWNEFLHEFYNTNTIVEKGFNKSEDISMWQLYHFPKCKQFDFGDAITCKQKKKWRKTTLSCHVHFSTKLLILR
ncbi:hypothetical protein RFI_31269, partial [Reticulomyxa filosa]